MGKITKTAYLILLIISIACFALPNPYWMISIASIVVMITIWFVKFTWGIATAADNFVAKYQNNHENYEQEENGWNKSKTRG